MMNPSTLDAGIPILTEVIAVPQHAAPQDRDLATPAAAITEPEPMPPEDQGWIEDEWNRMERKISGHILQQLMARLDSEIEGRVRDGLADVLQTAVEGLANEIKRNLQRNLEQVISEAVAEEVERIRSLKE